VRSAGSFGGVQSSRGRAEAPAAMLGLIPPLENVEAAVDVATFRAKAVSALQNGAQVLGEEFMAVRRTTERDPGLRERITPQTAEIVERNRYSNIVTLEESRVKLRDGAYVNASWLGLQGLESRSYIAAQAPLPNSFEDFWAMCWENEVPLVLMLTKWAEDAGSIVRVKADPYLPLEEGKTESFGGFEVSCVQVDESQREELGASVRLLSFRNKSIENGEPRSIYHVHYTEWPDFGHVEDLQSYLRLHQLVRTLENEILNSRLEKSNFVVAAPPTVNHCSAGIGRTGTFIALDAVFTWITEQAAKSPTEKVTLDVKAIVLDLRNRRPGTVFSSSQYVMIYRVLLFSFFGNDGITPSSEEGDHEDVAASSLTDAERYRRGS